MIAPCAFPTRQGTQIFIRDLAKALSLSGHEIHLVTYGHGEYEEDSEFFIHRTPLIDTGLRSGPHLLKPVVDIALYLLALKVIAGYDCDIIHAHNVEGLAIGAILKIHTKKPLVYHSHNCLSLELPTYYKFTLMKFLASAVGELFDRLLPRIANRVIVFNPESAELLMDQGVPRERVKVIPPGLWLEDIVDCENQLLLSVLRQQCGEGFLLYAGNPDCYQNLELMYEAVKHVCTEIPANLVIASSEPKSTFLKLFANSSKDLEINYVQTSSWDELRCLFHLAKVGLCPRVLRGGFPIKIINYLGGGLPIVACRKSLDSLDGWPGIELVEDSPYAFAAGIVKQWNSDHELNEHNKILAMFDIRNQTTAYDELYKELIN